MDTKGRKELATIKVYLNTGLILALVGVGFLSGTLIVGIVFLIIKWFEALWFYIIQYLKL